VNGHPPIVNEEVDYLVEDNAMDDICLSQNWMEPLVCPLLNIVLNIKTSEKSNFRKNDTTVITNWEQNASA
jgi:hypothetical protein